MCVTLGHEKFGGGGETGDGGYAFVLPGEHALADGPAALVAVLVDTSGNESSGLAAGAVTLDFTPPRVLELRVVAPREADGGVVEVQPGEPMQARLSLSEPVRPGLALVQRPVDCAAPAVAWQLGTQAAGTADFWRGPLASAWCCTAARRRAPRAWATCGSSAPWPSAR